MDKKTRKQPESDDSDTTYSGEEDDTKIVQRPQAKKMRKEKASFFDQPVNPLTQNPRSTRYFKLLKERQQLPCWQQKQHFLDLVASNQVVLLVSETGSGKTTQMPQFLIESLSASSGMIACTQPRRVAATSVAQRVSEELDVKLGEQVGYSVRFDDCSSQETLLKYMTDGMLLREAMFDSMLSRYSYILLDEAHERTLATDLLFGLIKEILPKRKDLKIIIMSATLDAATFQKFFTNDRFIPPILDIKGRLYPVELHHIDADHVDNYLDAAVETAVEILTSTEEGNVLLFLTGEEEIENAVELIESKVSEENSSLPVRVMPLYSSLPLSVQQKIFTDDGKERRVIVSTNIAETSVTIPNIKFVIDPGFSKQSLYNPRTRVESLLVTPISKASAKQRAGRAGRVCAGICYRLYTVDAYVALLESTPPELIRSNLKSVVLTLLRLGVASVPNFNFITPPSPETLMRAVEELHWLKCINEDGELTDRGLAVSDLPIDATLAIFLIEASKLNVLEEALTITAVLSVPPIFLSGKKDRKSAERAHKKFTDASSDHITLLNAFESFQKQLQTKTSDGPQKWCIKNFLNFRSLKAASDVREQLQRLISKLPSKILKPYKNNKNSDSSTESQPPSREYLIRAALIKSFFLQTAMIEKKTIYKTTNKDAQETVIIHPSTGLGASPEFVVFHEFVLTNKKYVRTVTSVTPKMLAEIVPEFFNDEHIHADAFKRIKKCFKKDD
jgi:pre-mRNA-splicing factor ATP-dependent RNA helicase DHX15/PRP43